MNQAKRPTTQSRNEAILKRYQDLKKDNKYKSSYIFSLLAKEFFLSERRIEDILTGNI